MNDVLNKLPWLESWESVFPVELCTHPGSEGVKESLEYLLCCVVDKRFADQLEIRLLRPYTWRGKVDGKAETLYGWVDSNGNLVDNKTRCINHDDAQVVAWSKS